MAFFKFRKNSDAPTGAPVQPESIERMRLRAKHRLIGASVLVLIGVIGFPMMFDKQPRPIAVDTPIDIPDKNKVLPLAIPASVASQTAVPVPAQAPASALQSVLITETAEPPKPDKPIESKVISSPAPHASSASKTVANDETKSAEAERAQALLNGKTNGAKPVPNEARFVVQVGAFADSTRAREVRLKLEHAGMKTYTHVAETKDGRRIRVRVGPFAVKADAEKAVEKIKKLNFSAALLTL
jgi:DedD protein